MYNYNLCTRYPSTFKMSVITNELQYSKIIDVLKQYRVVCVCIENCSISWLTSTRHLNSTGIHHIYSGFSTVLYKTEV